MSISRWRLQVALFVSLFAPAAAAVPAIAAEAPTTTQVAATEAAETHFLRFVGDSKTGGQLQTSEVTLKNDKGVTVHLVSAVHIGEASYYHDLQKSFEDCDAVLYEMVKSRDSGPPVRGQHSDSAVSKLQRFLKDTLNLSFQLDEVDYSPKNFIHADMDAETFQKLQQERGESFAGIFLQSLMKAMSDPSVGRVYDDEPVDLVDFMTRPDGDHQLKLLLARRLGDIEREASGLDMLNGTVILTERNKAVTKALKQAIADGKKNIAIFYGAAHMVDLSDRLDLMGFKPVSTTWHTAWDVKIRPDAPSAFMKLMSKTQQMLQDQQQAQ